MSSNIAILAKRRNSGKEEIHYNFSGVNGGIQWEDKPYF